MRGIHFRHTVTIVCIQFLSSVFQRALRSCSCIRVINSYLETMYNTRIVQDEVYSIYQSQPSKKWKYDGQRKPPSCHNGYTSKPCSKFILRHFSPKIKTSRAFTLQRVFNRAVEGRQNPLQIVKEPFKVADTVLFFKQKQTWRQVVDSLGGAAIYGIARTQVTQTKREAEVE